MDIGKMFTQIFEDKEWPTKVLVGGILVLLGFLVVPGILVGGYMIQYVRQVANREGTTLPPWADWGEYFAKGVLSFFISLVYSLPMIVLSGCISLFSTLAGQNNNGDPTLATVASICLGLPMAVYGLIIAIVLPAARVRYAVSNDVGAAFRFGEVFALISNSLGDYVMFLVVTVLAGLAAVLVGLVTLPLCGLGLLVLPFAIFWSYAVMALALGEFYARRSTAPAPAPTAVETL
jgi:hypothetical protein